MNKDYSVKNNVKCGNPKMRMEGNATYLDVPIVARSLSYQQPIEEVLDMTEESLIKRDRYGR